MNNYELNQGQKSKSCVIYLIYIQIYKQKVDIYIYGINKKENFPFLGSFRWTNIDSIMKK